MINYEIMIDNKDIKKSFLTLKRAMFDKIYSSLNTEQRKAVYSVNGPLLVLAGAGSGKTTVLVRRIAHILRFGNAYFDTALPPDLDENELFRLQKIYNEADVDTIASELERYCTGVCNPWEVMTITFTNKAANEMKVRLGKILGETVGADVWAGTFHSICVRILRKYTIQAGLKPNFTIYDTDDCKKIITQCIKNMNLDDKVFVPRNVMNIISRAKDSLMSPEEFEAVNKKDYKLQNVARIYAKYTMVLEDANAVDFDDIIYRTVNLLKNCEEAREYYQRRFKYVCIDEYQDTNKAQFELAKLLTGRYRNIMVVGDDDQSIYKFRGATIENILTFNKTFDDAKTIKLEQNYRSTGNILSAANDVIKNNKGRLGKNLWSAGDMGEKIIVKNLSNQIEEGKYITNVISTSVLSEGRKYGDFAILYRMNAQSNALESVFARSGIPYKILGGTRFYDRKEIKDILAYLSLMCNRSDDIRLERVINEPKRKIGETTVKAIRDIAAVERCSMFSVMERAREYTALSKSADKLIQFCDLINELDAMSTQMPLNSLFEEVINKTGYMAMLLTMADTEIDRVQNVQELVSNALEYQNNDPEPTLRGFLENVALISDIDSYDDSSDAVVMMTIHSAKGLEFPVVFLPGLEEGIFPGMQSSAIPEELEEERRLAYVAITRAKTKLYMTYVHERMLFGRSQYNKPSRFVGEISKENADFGLTYKEKMEQNREAQRKAVESARKPYSKIPPAPMKKPTQKQEINVGDIVEHVMFGKGDVMSVTKMGADVLYEIAFETVGTKKLMGSYVKLKKL